MLRPGAAVLSLSAPCLFQRPHTPSTVSCTLPWSNELTLDNCIYMQNIHIKDITVMAAQPKLPELCSCSKE